MLRRTIIKRSHGVPAVPPIVNERMDTFAPGSKELATTLAACAEIRGRAAPRECPIVIGGKRFTTDASFTRTMPSDHSVKLAKGYNATPELAKAAVASSLEAFESWSRVPFADRAAIILRAAHLITAKYRSQVLAATMLGQSKNLWQAEIDSVAESADFLRFNVQYASEIYREQPLSPPSPSVWNISEYRPLEGFVAAISPFNFTAIGVNLATAPVLMGNCVIWKPSPSALLSNYEMLEIFEEAGLPPGVINFLPCEPQVMNNEVTLHPMLAGVAFTGSTQVFNAIQKTVVNNLDSYRSYPRVSGETGGKNFHVLHPSCDLKHAVAGTIRSAFEYQGQKCSACSRIYVPRSMADEARKLLLEAHSQVVVGQPDNAKSFVCAVIDANAYKKITGFIEGARSESCCKVIAGGTYSDKEGFFVQPTIIESTNPLSLTMREEIFGPVLTMYVYEDKDWSTMLDTVDKSTKYGLTGGLFARDRYALIEAAERLRYSAGNFYINDKSTGAVVGQQPFGGSRQSGTNDKPGAAQFLHRWVSARTIKENFDFSTQISYPHQLPDNVFVKLIRGMRREIK